MVFKRPPVDSRLFTKKSTTSLFKKRGNNLKKRSTRTFKIKAFNVNISTGLSGIFKSLSLKKQQNLKKFSVICRSRNGK